MGVLYARVGGGWQEVAGGTGGGGGGPATPTGPAGAGGGDLTGTYPDPELKSGSVGTAEIAAGVVGLAHLSATGTKNTTTFLRGDNTFAVPSSGGTNPTGPATGDLTGNYPAPTIGAGKVDGTKLASGVVGMAHLSATGTKDNTTFLRGDNTFASPAASALANDSVTNLILTNMAANTVKGRLGSVGDPQDLTAAQLTTLVDPFSTSLKGVAPASGGGTVNFLRADGTWAVPPSSGVSEDARITVVEGATAVLPANDRPYKYLDEFAGANDDAKLTAALTYMQAQTYPGTIRFKNRVYSFSSVKTPYSGLSLAGPGAYTGHRYSSADTGLTKARAFEINLTFDSSVNGQGWFHSTGEYWNINFDSLVIRDSSGVGGSHPSLITNTSGALVHMLNIKDLSTIGMWTVCGTPTVPLTILTSAFHGPGWHINGGWNTAFSLAGSDSVLWPEGCLLDSPGSGGGLEGPTNFHPGGTTTYHLRLVSMDMTTVGPMYITAGTDWRGIFISGPAYDTTTGNNGIVRFYGTRVEGRNVTTPSHGNLVRVTGGHAIFNSCWFAKAMSNPTASEDGVIHQTGGTLSVDGGCHYNRANSVAESVPFIYTEGASRCRVYNVLTAVSQNASGWGGDLPIVNNAQSAGGQMKNDDTVTVI